MNNVYTSAFKGERSKNWSMYKAYAYCILKRAHKLETVLDVLVREESFSDEACKMLSKFAYVIYGVEVR